MCGYRGRCTPSTDRVNDVNRYGSAELFLDVTRGKESGKGSEALVITPVLRVEGTGTDAAPFAFIGQEGHGVVYIDRAEIQASADHGDWRLRLARLAITGTPMENNLMELWPLLSITAPGLFPNPTRFRDYYARPIEKQGDADLLEQL